MFKLNNKKGFALVTAYMVILVLIILAIVLNARSINESNLSNVQKKSIQALAIAEAGLEQALYDLKQDFIADPASGWTDGDINGHTWAVSASLTPFYSDNFGEGSYEVELATSGSNDAIWVRSTGTIGTINKAIKSYVRMTDVSPWSNAIFAGVGASGQLINGNVAVAGSVHILGDDLPDGALALDMGGTSSIVSNYREMDPALLARIPDLLQVDLDGDGVPEAFTLDSKIRVRKGIVNLKGNAHIGEDPEVIGIGDQWKETVTGTYVTDGFTTNVDFEPDGIPDFRIYSDNGMHNSYDLGDSITFPSLNDAYVDNNGVAWSNYQAFACNPANPDVFVISNPADLNKLANDFTPSSNWTIGCGATDNGCLTLQNGNLDIGNKVVCVANSGNLNMTAKGPNDTITYTGKGTIYVSGNVNINANLLTPDTGKNSYPVNNIVGIITPNTIMFNAAQLDVMGLFYAENEIISAKQTDVVGSFVSNYFDMGTNVPSIFYVPEIKNNLPPGMVGWPPHWVMEVVSWQRDEP